MSNTSHNRDLLKIIRSVRNRWRLKLALRGLAVTLGIGLVVVLGAAFIMDYLRFTPAAVSVTRIMVYAALLLLLVRFVILPLTRTATDERVALYLEEHEPSLQAALLSAVETDRAAAAEVSPGFIRRMIEQAISACQDIDNGRRVEQRNLRRASGILAGVLTAAALVGVWSPAFLRHALPFLLFPWGSEATVNPYSINVEPGDIRIALGSDQLISARLLGFDNTHTRLLLKRGDKPDWQEFVMTPGSEPGAYEMFVFDLEQPLDYYVEAGGVTSQSYHIDVVELPAVEKMTLEYNYPDYTGLQPRIEEDGGDINALQGTRIAFRIEPSIAVGKGDIVLENGDRIPLTAAPDGQLSAEMTIEQDGYYRIELEAGYGEMVKASPDYIIAAQEDQPPNVVISQPGRDSKVTQVEEPLFEVKAEDDLNVGQLDLMLSVNGAPAETVTLHQSNSQEKKITGQHVVYLEDLGLHPGDLISYYARARDSAVTGQGQEAATDIFFLEIRPFERDFRQASQQGGMGGDPGANQGTLSAQQRELVVALFKLIRDRDTYLEETFNENLDTVSHAQERIRDRVEAIIRRLGTRNIMQMEEGYQVMAEELPKAVDAMVETEAALSKRDPDKALPSAQQALQHLQRADAAFREVQVTQNNQSGSGQNSGDADEDLANLFKLELDKLRNQYENIQSGQQESAEQQIDEVMQKLRELARRQQQENERQRRHAELPRSAGGSGSGNQQRLAEQVEELERQLERLTREQPDNSELQDMQKRLQQAAESMRRAADSQSSERLAQGLDAIEQLSEARRLLDKSRAAQLNQQIQDVQRQAENLANKQQQVAQGVRDLDRDSGEQRNQQLQDVLDDKRDMFRNLQQLQKDLDQLARESKEPQPDAAQKLQEAANSIRSNELEDKIRQSWNVIQNRTPEYIEEYEQGISSSIDEMREKIDQAATEVGETREQQLVRSLDQMQELIQNMEGMRQRMRERNTQPAESGDQQQADGTQSGPQNENQPGEQQAATDQQNGQQKGDQQQQQSADTSRPGEQNQQNAQQQGDNPLQTAQGAGESQQQDGQGQQQQPGQQSGQQAQSEQQSGQQPGPQGQSGQQQAQSDQPGQQPGQQSGQQSGQQPGQQSEQQAQSDQQQGGQQPGQQAQSGQQQGGQQPGQQAQSGQQQGDQQPGQPGQSGQATPGGFQQGGGIASSGYSAPRNGDWEADSRYNDFNPEDIQKFMEEFREYRGDLEQLRRGLTAQNFSKADVDAVLQKLRALEQQAIYGNPQELARTQAASIEALKELEYSLRSELQGDLANRLILSGNEEIPAAFREVVEEYYRSLSRRGERAKNNN